MSKDNETLREWMRYPLDDELSHEAFTEGYLTGWNMCMSLVHYLGRKDATIAEAYYTLLHHWNVLHDRTDVGFDILDIDRDTFKERPFKGIRFKQGYIYILRADNGMCKIGQTTQLDNRIKQLGIQLPYELEFVHAIATDHVMNAERLLHERYIDRKQRGEWFALTDEDLEELKTLDYLFAASGDKIAMWFANLAFKEKQNEPKQNQG